MQQGFLRPSQQKARSGCTEVALACRAARSEGALGLDTRLRMLAMPSHRLPCPDVNQLVKSRQIGSAMLQWCIAALPLLLLGSLSIELSQWHLTRQQLALMAQRSVDAAALDGGTISALRRHFQANRPADWKTPMTVCIIDRVDRLMTDFVDHNLSRRLGKKVIRHDHIEQQHLDALKRGWPGGLGPSSRQSISAANRLTIQVSANYRPVSPWIRRLVHPVTIRLVHQAIMQSHRQASHQDCMTLASPHPTSGLRGQHLNKPFALLH
jgi:hypothetical protein